MMDENVVQMVEDENCVDVVEDAGADASATVEEGVLIVGGSRNMCVGVVALVEDAEDGDVEDALDVI